VCRARIWRAATRPALPRAPAPICRPGLLIDPARREARLDGEDLTHMEFELLNHLVGHRGRTVGWVELLGFPRKNTGEVPGERAVDVHIHRLRCKLGRLSGIVRTVPGQGYRFHGHPDVAVWAGYGI
jgi:DNA-binding response OmpR family regulator